MSWFKKIIHSFSARSGAAAATPRGPDIGHIRNVGVDKAMGLLTLREIAQLGHDGQSLGAVFNRTAGYMVLHFRAGDKMWGDIVSADMASLAVVHLPMLQKLLDENRGVLVRTGWPQDAEGFACRSFEEFVLKQDADTTALQGLVKKAYNRTAPK